ncbi:hypothetical protein MRB53_030949 [Persea americana]|uniref:Uncharacterized protein n=1 Tax=Persea americana TaxID=3435 RepID=A0ACC2KN32_PERAE|nr:hypothetical protein MRB53_030949 [Persea americana]
MLKAGLRGDSFTFPFVAKACAKLNLLMDGKKIHAHTFLLGFQHDVFVQTAIMIDMYSKCADLASSRQMFEEMPTRSLVSWNSMISTYSRHFQIDESLGLFKEMRVHGFEPNSSKDRALLIRHLRRSVILSLYCAQ